MNKHAVQKPEVDKKLLYGGIASFSVQPGIVKEREKYRFKILVRFENVSEEIAIQRGGYLKRSDAEKAKQLATVALHNHTFVPYDFKLKEFYDYWLYYYMIDRKNITYNTFISYRNCIYNYILPELGENKKLSQIGYKTVVNFLKDISSESVFNSIKGVLFSSFNYAKSRNLISFNHIPSAIKLVANQRKKEKKRKNMETGSDFKPESKFKVMNAEQAALLLYTCKTHEPDIYMPLLFTITTGLRISEAFAVKFQDIDFRKKELYVQRQVGRRIDGNELNSGPVSAQELDPKSSRGTRIIPVPDFVIEEIVLAKKRYLEMKAAEPDFRDNDYIACRKNGNAIPVTTAYTPYKHLYNICNLQYLKWHELRHTYATLLATENINMKAVSECMGHFRENFTLDVYVAPQKPIYDAVEELTNFSESVIPNSAKNRFVKNVELISNEYILELLPENIYNKK